jgi:hypothetical protein
MTNQEFIYRACCYAISELVVKGSSSFATKVNGKLIKKDWMLILDELYNLLVEEEKRNNDDRAGAQENAKSGRYDQRRG